MEFQVISEWTTFELRQQIAFSSITTRKSLVILMRRENCVVKSQGS